MDAIKKIKVFCTVSLILSFFAIAFCWYNFNGAFTEPLRDSNVVGFWGGLTVPVFAALIALILSIVSQVIVTIIGQAMKSDK